jgi:hypothetical protein
MSTEVQSFASSPLTSHPAIQAQRTGNNSFMSPSILHPQNAGSTRDSSVSGSGAEADDEREDDGIAREKKGEKEQMPMEKNLYVGRLLISSAGLCQASSY